MAKKVFIGRSKERLDFNRKLDDLLDSGLEKPYVTLLYGNGGIGKTTLCRKMMELEPVEVPPYPDSFQHVYIDWQEAHLVHDRIRVMDAVTPDAMLDALHKEIIVAQPNWKSSFKGFEKINEKTIQVEAKLLKLAKKDGKFGAVIHYLSKAGLAGLASALFQDASGVVGATVAAGTTALDKFVDDKLGDTKFKEQLNEFQSHILGNLNGADLQLLRNHLNIKAEALGRGLNEIAGSKPIIIALDTYERIDKADHYLRQVIKAASTRVVWIIAGRQNIFKNRELRQNGVRTTLTGYEAGRGHDYDVEPIEVSKFAELDVKEYFEQYSLALPDDNALRHVYDVTRGIPLAVETAAEIWRGSQDLEDIGSVIDDKAESEIVKEMVERYLRHQVEEQDKHALYALAFSEGDVGILRAMLNLENQSLDVKLSELAQKYATVYKDGKNLHDEPAGFFRENLKTLRTEPWLIEYNNRVVETLKSKLANEYNDLVSLEECCDDSDWTNDNLNLIKHMMWVDQYKDEAWDRITNSFIDSMVYGDGQEELKQLVKSQIGLYQTRYSKRLKCLIEANNVFGTSSETIDYLRKLLKNSLPKTDNQKERESILCYQLGSIFYWNKTYDTAKEFIDLAIDSVPQSCNTVAEKIYDRLWDLGVTFKEQSEYQEAINIYNVILQSGFENQAGILNSLGIVYSDSGENEEAIEVYKKSLELRPDDASTLSNLGIAYRQSGQNEEAIETYKKSLELRPDNTKTLYNLGIAYNESGRQEEAIEAYKKSLELRPDDTNTLHNLGIAYRQSGQNEEAIKVYKKSLELRPDDTNTLHNLAFAYVSITDTKNAVKFYKKSLEVDSQSFMTNFDLAAVYRSLNQENEFRFYLEEARKLKDSENSEYNLACFAALDNDFELAIQLLEKALQKVSGYCNSLNVEPAFDIIKDDERFKDLQSRYCEKA